MFFNSSGDGYPFLRGKPLRSGSRRTGTPSECSSWSTGNLLKSSGWKRSPSGWWGWRFPAVVLRKPSKFSFPILSNLSGSYWPKKIAARGRDSEKKLTIQYEQIIPRSDIPDEAFLIAEPYKSEIRNPKENSNDPISQLIRNVIVLIIRILDLSSACFGFRVSDFGFICS